MVEAVLPRNGAKIVKQPRRALQGDKEDRYGVISSDGTLKRVLFVDRKNGKVYEELEDDDSSEYEGRFSNTIKLGLVSFFQGFHFLYSEISFSSHPLVSYPFRVILSFTRFLLLNQHSIASLASYHRS